MQACVGATWRRRVTIAALVVLIAILPAATIGAATPPKPVAVQGIAGGSHPTKSGGKAKTPSAPKRSLVTQNFGLAQTIPEPTNSANQYFGTPVTVSKDNTIAVISATGQGTPGKVWVYTRDINGLWANPVALPPPIPNDLGNDFQFGFSTAINNDSANRTILVGTRGGSGNFGAPGAVYAYVLIGATWTFQQELKPLVGVNNPLSPDGPTDAFGWSVALSSDGNTALVGAPETNISGMTRQGLVYVYTRSGATWTNTQHFTDTIAPNTTGDHFGGSVALSDDGTIALIGADSKNNYKGDAFVYTGSAGVFDVSAAGEKLLAAGDGAGGDVFGWSVSLSGDGKTALVGAFSHVDPDTTRNPTASQTGSAYMFINTGGTWGAPQELNESVNTQYDLYGYRVAISGDGMTAVVGAPTYGNIGEGATWIYARSGASFVPLGQQPIDSPDGTGSDDFGVGVAVPQIGKDIIIGESTHQVGANANQGEFFDYALSPDLAPAAGALPAGTVGTAYTQQFTGSNGAGTPYTYSSTTGTLPPGLTLAPNGANAGLLSGTPTQAGDYTFSVTVTDKAGGMTTQSSYTLHIAAATTTVAVTPVTAPFSAATQNITLTATVTDGIAVNEGTVTFAVTQGVNPIGTSVTSGTVTGGAATAMFAAPAGMLPGSYTITATYNPAATNPNFLTNMNTGTLTISPAPTTVMVTNASAPFSAVAQNVTLSATVSAAIPVNEGTVTFAVTKGATPIGTAVTSGTVVNGAASAVFSLPGGTSAGGYTITAVYNPAASNPSFTTSTGTGTLTVGTAATTVAVTNATAPFSAAAQNVTLAATVSAAVPVNEGAVTFTVKQGATTIGVPVTSGTVVNGAATAVFSLPGNTAAGAYTITATYNPAATNPNFTTSTGTGTLTVVSGVATTTTTVTNASAVVAPTVQNITLTATVASSAPVNEGTVTFTVKQGATTIGAAVTSGTVTNGAASATFVLPANTPAGGYMITAVYNPAAANPNFATSTGTGTLTIVAGAGATATTATNETAFFAATAQNVTLSATVASTAPVNEGTVTFTVKQGVTTIGVPVTSGTVTNGVASATFVLPGNTAAGMYTITAVYNPAATNPNFTTSTGTGTLTVTTATITKITITPASATVKVGASAQFTATATLSDATSANVSDQAQWNASNASIATVDSHGKATGQSPGGPVTITAVLNGITSNGVTVTVSSPTAIGIQVPPAPQSRPSGTTSEPGSAPAPAPAPSAPAVGGSSGPGPAPAPTGR